MVSSLGATLSQLLYQLEDHRVTEVRFNIRDLNAISLSRELCLNPALSYFDLVLKRVIAVNNTLIKYREKLFNNG
ncbi:hypothetical protein AWT69_002757 [Pseudomonas putida]|nr:hypothetical protein AWT69_002757 [Pseudomonas putida]